MSDSATLDTAAARPRPEAWRFVVLLQQWLLLAATGLFATWGMVLAMSLTLTAFVLSYVAMCLINDQERRRCST